MPGEEPLYVGIADPVDLRKDLLNASRILISSLKEYEKFNAIKEEKSQYLSEFTKTVREINILNRRIKQLMPKTRIKPGMIKKPMRPAPSRIIDEKTKLAHLEDELVEVEEKLAKLE